jgi:hypothetical protein
LKWAAQTGQWPRAMASRAAAAWIGGRRPELGRSAARAKASRHMEGGSSRGSDSSDSTGDGGYAGAIARRDVIGRCHRRVRRRAIARPGVGALRCAASKTGQSTARRMVTTRTRLPITTAVCRRQQADKTRWGGGCRVSSLAMTSSPQRHVPGHCNGRGLLRCLAS